MIEGKRGNQLDTWPAAFGDSEKSWVYVNDMSMIILNKRYPLNSSHHLLFEFNFWCGSD